MSSYIPYVAWGLCPGGSNTERISYFASWGLISDVTNTTPPVVTGLVLRLRNMFDLFYYTTKKLFDLF